MDLYIAIIGSSALAALISGVFNTIKDKKSCKDGVREGVRQLLYDRIKFLGQKYIAAGEISAEDLEDLIDMHKIYHSQLGGNGFLDKIMERVKILKLFNKEEKS